MPNWHETKFSKLTKRQTEKNMLNLMIFSKVLQMFTSCKHKVIRKTFPLANFRTITVKQSIIFCFSLNLLRPSGYPKELKVWNNKLHLFIKFWLNISLCQNINFELHLLLFSVNYKVTSVSVALLPLWPAIYL